MKLKKGDVVAVFRTSTAQFVIGSGKPSVSHDEYRLVRVASASRDGKVMNKYQTTPSSPVYMSRNSDGQVMPIGGAQQQRARRLFESATEPFLFPSKEAIQRAILETLTEAELRDIGLYLGWSSTLGYTPDLRTFMNSLDTEGKRAEWRRIHKWTRAGICREVMRRAAMGV